ncbi:MAG TPA: MBL fold metallo-hydrolase [Caldithrix abyssi]|uniref:MBL fold metallo-hydrolase n=1 Tax=Caldithrix abyssi TaxID=187145 RepID=A0A7V5PPZ4_CALAY|nr:MBL fold metallo-hydrolase [Caldithrix abyssi]
MKIETITVGPLAVNCYLAVDEQTSACLIIDPGDDPQRVISHVEQRGYQPQKVLFTHGHIDHVCRAARVIEHFEVPFYFGEHEKPIVDMLPVQAEWFNFEFIPLPSDYRPLSEGQTVTCGNVEFRVLHTPGHSPGSVCFYAPGTLLSGDVLFRDSIGRTDIYGGDMSALIHSIRSKIFTLPEETIVYPGHGPTTTVGWEKAHNPFVGQNA